MMRNIYILLSLVATSPLSAAEPSSRDQAAEALCRSVAFYATQVASHGGYVYKYSADMARREGEGKTGPDTVWVQPPGTPAVGMAYLDAWELTGEAYLLDAAKAAGECLVRGQLRSGGWTDRIEFDPPARAKFAYRVDPPRPRGFNVSTFDDDKTQSAVRMLCRLDRALKLKDQRIHEAALFALDSILKAQFPNGAWAQGFDQPIDPAKHPVKPATYPDAWPRQYPGGRYWWHYTFNDNTIADTIETLLLAAEVYAEPRYRDAALRAGDFIILAQLPEPQPAWAQQYSFDMHPAWARKFEPPAVSGSESQQLIRILMRLYVETSDPKFLKPIPPAIAWLRRSVLPDGRLARFYELRTNRPLHFTKTYELTYNDGDVPTHYAFKVSNGGDSLAREHQQLSALTPQQLAELRGSRTDPPLRVPSAEQVSKVIAGLDDRGAWVEAGRLRYHGEDDDTRQIIDSQTFIRNIGLLSRAMADPTAAKAR